MGAQKQIGVKPWRSRQVVKERQWQWGDAAKPLFHSRRAARNSLSICTCVYISDSILRIAARQKQLAKFKTPKIFFSLELPRFRQRIVCFHASNLARMRRVHIKAGRIWLKPMRGKTREWACMGEGKAHERASRFVGAIRKPHRERRG